MPTRQIPLLSNQGVYQALDVGGEFASYPYFLNGYFEKTGNEDKESRKYAFVKRPGMRTKLISGFTNNHRIQGMRSSVDRSSMIFFTNDNAAANRTWYWDGTTLTNVGAAPAGFTTTGAVAFTTLDGISYGANVYYAAMDINNSVGAVINQTGTWTKITDADFGGGGTITTNILGLNGYLFVGTLSNRIYNSDLNASTAWTSTSFIACKDTPGKIVWLGRIRNMIVAFKERSIEFFEDVGNPTPGSPLEARTQYNRNVGCANRSTIQEVSDGIIFAGVTDSGAPKLYKLKKADLQLEEVSNRFMEQCLANVYPNYIYSVDATAASVLAGGVTYAFDGQTQAFSFGGKEFYTINLRDPNVAGSSSNITQVYDNSLGVWTSWATFMSGTQDTLGFVGSQAQMVGTTIINESVGVAFANNYPSGASAGPTVVYCDILSPFWTDSPDGTTTNSYNMSWTSDLMDFGNRKRKFMDAFEVIYDSNSAATPNFGSLATMTLRYRDWDYIKNVNYYVTKTLKMDEGSALRARTLQLGSFRRRVFTLAFNASFAMRIWAIEVDIQQGETDQEG
jgi:hypothetical protein